MPVLKPPEGIKKQFYDVYNDTSLTGSITNKSLRKKVEQFRNLMAIDFYNLKPEDDIAGFAEKYIGYTSDELLPGISISLTGFDAVRLYAEEHQIFKAIVDKVLQRELLSDEEIAHINKAFCGEVGQRETGVLWQKFYFANFGAIRALYDFVIQLSKEGFITNVHRCEAPRCKKLFLSVAGGSERLYCSIACKQRAYRDRRRQMAAV